MGRLSAPLAGFFLLALIAADPQISVQERREKLKEIFDSIRNVGSEAVVGCDEECDVGSRPVCGSNDVVYLNDCLLRRASCDDASITRRHEGPCVVGQGSECREECQRIYIPLCGTDGRTYHNKCLLDLASCRSLGAGRGPVRVAQEGPCSVPDDCRRDCSDVYSPVCGSDGVTYGNDCWLGVASCLDVGVRRASSGECGGRVSSSASSSGTCREECTRIYLPVCGTDGRTYNNKCMLEASSCLGTKEGKEAIAVAHDGPCDIPVSCRKDCASAYRPKCASNGVTYGNTCWLSVAQCLNPDIRESHDGECRQDSAIRCVERCNKIYTPVCGTDGETYNNKCIMDAANCRSVRDGKGSIRVAHEGLCERDRNCQRNCSIGYQPICATNGITYDNDCLFAIAKCLNNQLRADYKGVCVATEDPVCSSPCNEPDNPVCGSDGRTYRNRCLLNKTACLHKGLIILYKGSCQAHQ